MSAAATLYLNGKRVGEIPDFDWRAYVKRHYPGCSYELKDGYRVEVTVSVVQAMEIVEGRKSRG